MMLTANGAIREYLADKAPVLRAHVSDDGVIRHEEPEGELGKAALGALRTLVVQELSAAELVRVDPVEFAQLVAAPKKRAGTEGANEDVKPKSQASSIADHIIAVGIEKDASDVFLDIREDEDRAEVTYKVHGRVIESDTQLDTKTALKVVRAMWTRGNSDWDASAPCDVSFTVEGGDDQVTRIRGNSLLEKTRGYTIACRLRNPKEIIPLKRAGYLPMQLAALRRMSQASGGLLIIAGPTDSGKSTTLTAIIDAMPHSLRKIEVADPPEIFLDHCTHVTIARRVDGSYEGLDKVLGATVRQNPDVLILGEIRDKLSAAAAMGMAQQGKRVYTSLHANGCAGVPPRLADFGIELNLLGFKEFFSGCVSQNLIALLCPECSRPAQEKHTSEKEFLKLFGDVIRFTGPGCEQCADGVIGQTVVAQVYPLVDDHGPAYELIRKGEFARLAQYMEKEHDVRDKHASAAALIMNGRADASDVVRRIGRFPQRTYHQVSQ